VNEPIRLITIDEIANATKLEELELNIRFSLHPSKDFFSKVNLGLYFQGTMLREQSEYLKLGWCQIVFGFQMF